MRLSRSWTFGLLATAAAVLLAAPGVASAATADALIGRSTDNAHVGDNVFNETGQDQTREWSVKRGNSRTFYVTVENDGASGRIDIKGCGSSSGFRVRYTSLNGTDITSSVREGTYGQQRNPGATVFAAMTIKAKNEAEVGDRKACKASGISASNRDVVKAVLTVAPG